MTRTKNFYWATIVFTGLGLLAGLYYRELTRNAAISGSTQLSTAHTHFLVLGTVLGLVFLLMEHFLRLSESRVFGGFFWTWIAGVVITVGTQVVKGSLQVLGSATADSAAISGISGLGHITLTVMFVLFFVALGGRLSAENTSSARTELVDQAA